MGVTPGCAAGIGPEVAAAALATTELDDDVHLTWCASAALLAEGARRARVDCARDGRTVTLDGRAIECAVDDDDDQARAVIPGHPSDDALAAQRDALLLAIAMADAGELDAIVTAPIRKAALDDVDGVAYPGHTELLAARLGSPDVPTMMGFCGGPFVLGLATTHLPLRDAPDAITPALVDAKLDAMASALRVVGHRTPTLAVLGLNPHAGEGGLLGSEEREIIAPALDRARVRHPGVLFEGPRPADGFFARLARGAEPPEGVLAMTHDQGLAPYKLLAAGGSVNVTFGLRVVRTSPDHGTADDIAGKGLASPSSMQAALQWAHRLVPRRRS